MGLPDASEGIYMRNGVSTDTRGAETAPVCRR